MSSKGKGKGKEVATFGKRKINGSEGKHGRKRRPGVLQFFEDAADVPYTDDSDESDFDEDDFMEEEPELNLNEATGKSQNVPFVPKEEVIEEEEFDRMMEERYRNGAGFVTHADDAFENKGSVDKDSPMSSAKGPTLWKVKCTVGRERHSVFCLMQKFVDLQSFGSKLNILSVFCVDHVKGFVYIESDKQCDINEACKGLSAIYYSRVAPVPKNEVSHLLSVRSMSSDVSAGMWARVKNGKYKGDLAQVVAVNGARKRATVKLVPRIDLQALAGKFGGGAPIKKIATPAPRLISSSELEEFRPLIQYRCDRDTGKHFEVLDGLMLKDGFLYKKVSIDSLSFWGIMPSEEELLKFKRSENSESSDLEWLSQLYGDKKTKRTVKNDKGGGKGEGSSSSSPEDTFDLYNLVCFGKKDFGLIVGKEKDDYYKILKEGSEGPLVVTVERRDLKGGPLDVKFSALDHQKKSISINDNVKVLEGSSKEKQGIVKQIYRGTVFLYDENETENGGYFCCKSQMCEKIKLFVDPSCGKDDEPGPSGFGEFPSSPKSPLVEEKPWQARESRNDFNRDKDGLFSIGQTLRIRVGPLKGYLCRVLAVHCSDVTVKLDSQQKVLTVKNEHLSEVNRKSTAVSTSEDNVSSSFKPFDLLGSEGWSGGWADGARSSAENDGWNTGGLSGEGNSWPSFAGSGIKPHAESSSSKSSWDAGPKKDDENNAWGNNLTKDQNSSWGAKVMDSEANNAQEDHDSGWVKKKTSDGENEGGWGKKSSWNSEAAIAEQDQDSGWGKKKTSDSGNEGGWGKKSSLNSEAAGAGQDQDSGWGKKKTGDGDEGSWGKKSWNLDAASAGEDQDSGWGRKKPSDGGNEGGWAKKSAWNSEAASAEQDQGSGWGKKKTSDSGTEGRWGKKSSLNSEAASAGQDQVSGWGKKKTSDGGNEGGSGKKSSWNSEAASSDIVQGSGWGKKKTSDSGHEGGWGNQSTCNSEAVSAGWGKKKTGDGDEGSWGKKSWNVDAASAGQDRDSGSGKKKPSDGYQGSWGKTGSWNSEATNAEQDKDSGFGKKKSSDGEQGAWGEKSSWNSGAASAKQDQDSSWGTKSSWNSDSADANKDSTWGKETNLTSGSADANGNLSWAKKSNWSSGAVDAHQESGWGGKGSWKSSSTSASQDSEWGNRGNWQSGSGNANKNSTWNNDGKWNSGDGNEDQTETFGNRGNGGNWRGRGNTDGGGFRGRGRSDRGGYGGRGRTDTGGFGGRGEGRGGFRGRGGRGFWGRGDRGGFGGRGRGRRDQSSEWNGNSGFADDKPFNWSKGTSHDQGWKQDDDEIKRNEGMGSGSSWKSWNSGSDSTSKQAGGWNSQGSSWGKDADGNSNTAGGWNRGEGSTNEADESENRNWKSSSWNQSAKKEEVDHSNSQESGWNKGSSGSANSGGWNSQGSSCGKVAGGNTNSAGGWNNIEGPTNEAVVSKNHDWKLSSWNQSAKKKEIDDGNSQGGGWSKGLGGSAKAGGWGNQGSGWEDSSGAGGTNDGQSSTCNQSNAAVGGQSSAWGQQKDAKEANANVRPTGSWGVGAACPWGKSSDGGQSSAWNHSKDEKEYTSGSWGKAAAGSWGKESDGSSKGGW